MESHDKESKLFVGFMAVCLTVMGLLFIVIAATIVVAVWQAGIKNFLVCMSAVLFIAWISKFVYRRLLESDWL